MYLRNPESAAFLKEQGIVVRLDPINLLLESCVRDALIATDAHVGEGLMPLAPWRLLFFPEIDPFDIKSEHQRMVMEVILRCIKKRVKPPRREKALHVRFERNILVMIAKQKTFS